MRNKLHSSIAILLAAVLGGACGGEGPKVQADSGPGGPDGSIDPTDLALYDTPQGELLAFGVHEGNLRNYFYRQGPVAVHLLTRSGTEPRVIAAFPAGNTGIGLWFEPVAEAVELRVGDDADLAAGGGLEGLLRKDSQLRGVRAVIESDATSLRLERAILANIRTLRDYIFATEPEPVMAHQVTAAGGVVMLQRTTIGDEYHIALYLRPLDGTIVKTGSTGSLEIEGGSAGIKVEVFALADDDALTPIEKANLVNGQAADSPRDLDTLAFLSTGEKLMAGSWRFLTYFGRDTLISVRMLMPVLQPQAIEGALSSVIENINLDPALQDTNFNYTVEVGDVAHEEDIGDYAAWKNSKKATPPADLRTPIFDYKMIDDDFMLAPVLAEFAKLHPDRVEAYLDRTRAIDGVSYRDTLAKNLDLVLARATPYAGSGAAGDLVALKAGVNVGEWRDSPEGLGNGTIAFNVNVALVPAALEAAQTLYGLLGDAAKATEAGTLLQGWSNVESHFAVQVQAAEAKTRVEAYAQKIGVSAAVSAELPAGGQVAYHAISLQKTAGGTAPVPVMHSDHGFTMLFTNPSAAYLQAAADEVSRTFPAGLFSEVGVMVANPALSGDAAVEDLFTKGHYHGTVVWSWQQAMLAAGIQRQLDRGAELDVNTLAALQRAQCKLWEVIEKANAVRTGELWTWVPDADGLPEYRPFGYDRTDQDESNAAQLWSTVYLAVQPPADLASLCLSALGR